jgi:enolase
MSGKKITALRGREILDSRGYPVVEAEAILACGIRARGIAPAGASVGQREAFELRDGDARFGGRGVLRAAQNVGGEIANAIVGMDAREQERIDDALIALDGEKNKSRLGANAILAASLAIAHAAAAAEGLALYQYLGDGGKTTLPTPLLNVINGGAHADNNLSIQEFMIVPAGFDSFAESLRAGAEIYHALRVLLKTRGLSTAVGDEGGFAPRLGGNEEALALLSEAIAAAHYRPGEQVWLALDCAASGFCQDGRYALDGDESERLNAAALCARYREWAGKYPLASIEDGMDENDDGGWQTMTAALGGTTQIVGDDLFATDPAAIARGAAQGLANAALIKPNQIGTLTETKRAIAAARKGGCAAVISHRSGDTDDATIADLAAATNAGQIKAGAPCRGERVAKYNRLLRIEEELGANAAFAGASVIRKR